MITTVDVVIVGAGVAGLVVAHDLARTGLRVTVLEGSDGVGGLLRRGVLDAGDGEATVDLGAESFATRTTGVADLIADAGLDLQVVAPAPAGAHLVAMTPDGIVRAPLPRRTVLGIPADPHAPDIERLLGADACARVAAERTLPPHRPDGDEPSLAALVAERCGPDLVARLVDPLCRSVYSQPADRVRLSRLHPTFWAEFLARGSLLEAADALASTSRTGSAVAGIEGGMWRLPVALRAAAERHGAEVRTEVAARRLEPDAATGAVRVVLDAETVTARAVVVATGSRAAATLLADIGGTSDAVPPASAPVRVVAALVRSETLDTHPAGSGVIVAPDVPSAAKALTHVSAKWAWAQRPGGHLVRLSARDAGAPGLDTPAELAREIALLTGAAVTAADVVAVATARWDDAVAAPPVDAARAQQLAAAGIHLTGASVAGTGLASVVPHARGLAAHLSSTLATTGSPV